MVALIDPDVVVLTGMIIDLPAMADRLVDRTRALLSPDHRARVELRRSTLGRQAWVRGAILVALQQVQPGLQHALAGAEPISTR